MVHGPAPRPGRGGRCRVRYETGATNLVVRRGRRAWSASPGGGSTRPGSVRAKAVVIAAGGFVMNADMVAEHTPALGSKLFTLGIDVRRRARHPARPRRPARAAGTWTSRSSPRRSTRRRCWSPGSSSTSEGGGSSPRTATTRAPAGSCSSSPTPRRTSSSTASTSSTRRCRWCRSSTASRPSRRWRRRSASRRARCGRPLRPLQRARRPRRGPGLPQAARMAGAAGQRPVGRLRPHPRHGAVRRLHPRRDAHQVDGQVQRPDGTVVPACTPPAPAPRTSPRTARATAPAPSSARGRSSAGGRAAATRPVDCRVEAPDRPFVRVRQPGQRPPFHVMDLLAAAAERQRTHGDPVNLRRRPAVARRRPVPVREAAKRALDQRRARLHRGAPASPSCARRSPAHHRRMHGHRRRPRRRRRHHRLVAAASCSRSSPRSRPATGWRSPGRATPATATC